MPIKGFGSVTTVTGVEEYISMTITGEQDELTVEPGAENTAITVTCYYNPRYNISIEGIYSGTTPGGTFTVLGNSFRTLTANVSETAGDVKKISITGVYYPSVTS